MTPVTRKWRWTYDDPPGAGGTEYSLTITKTDVEWLYTEDRWGRDDKQTHATFVETGPIWQDAPLEVIHEAAEQFGLRGPAWLKAGSFATGKPSYIIRSAA